MPSYVLPPDLPPDLPLPIAQSLSALGQVILALAEQAKAKGKGAAGGGGGGGGGGRTFVPYRNSKLTRVLQESLGGNSLTVMIACISPAEAHLEESLTTLQYADRAKAIQLRAVKNEQVSEVGRLRQEVNELRRKLSARLGASEQSEDDREELAAYRSQIELYEQKLQNSFEEREAACAALLGRERALREQVAAHHAQRRAQLSTNVHTHGRWMELLWRANVAWQQRAVTVDELQNLESEIRASEERWSGVVRYTTLVLETLGEATSQLTSMASGSGVAAAELRAELVSFVDLSATIDLSSADGKRALGSLGSHEASTLHVARQMVLRLCSLRTQLEKGRGYRKACVQLHGQLQARLVSERAQMMAGASAGNHLGAMLAMVPTAAGGDGGGTGTEEDVREACEDLEAMRIASRRRLRELHRLARAGAMVGAGLRDVGIGLSGALRAEAEQLRSPPPFAESERRRSQRLARYEEAANLAAEIEDEVQLSVFAEDDDDDDDIDDADDADRGGRVAAAAGALCGPRAAGGGTSSAARGADRSSGSDAWKAATSSGSLAPYLLPDGLASPPASSGDSGGVAGARQQLRGRKLSLAAVAAPRAAAADDAVAREGDGSGSAELAWIERLLGGLVVLERCAGHRLLHREQGRWASKEGRPVPVVGQPQPPPPPLLAHGEVAPSIAPSSPARASTVALLCSVAELKEELELSRKSNAQLLTVVSCQAASIEQITSGKGDERAREAQQQAALAEQAAQLSEMSQLIGAIKEQARRQHEMHAKDLVAKGGPAEGGTNHGGAGAHSAVAITADTVARELRMQLLQQAQLHEVMLKEHASEMARLGERAAKAEGRIATMEREVAVSREVRETMQSHIDEQAIELKTARAIEENFAALAAKLGCIDEEGQLMRSRLETLTMELVQARASEQEYQIWLADVKTMMASGKEDGLAMALAQNMMECRKKDELLQNQERELKRLRLLSRDGRKADPTMMARHATDAVMGMEPAPTKENPLFTQSYKPAALVSGIGDGGPVPQARPPAGSAVHAVARPRMPGRVAPRPVVPR